jgi:triphosphoribosyl-dephospho-CoA synthase
MTNSPTQIAIGDCAQLACLFEVTAPKAGNVRPGREFADLRCIDFWESAAAIKPILEQAPSQGVGQTVLKAIQATRAVVSSNTNLGIVLLLAPLAAVPRDQSLRAGIGSILKASTVQDSRQVFDAIRLVKPGGLGRVSDQDVVSEPTLPLRQIMALAADRDLVARQFAHDFEDVFDYGVPALLDGFQRFGNHGDAIVFTQLTILSRFGDSLILRKRGPDEAAIARTMAQGVLDAGWPKAESGREAFEAFDAWLREFGNARNPGTSADLVTACLFASFRDNVIAFDSPFDLDS